MSPLDWLRRQRKPRYTFGGYVNGDQEVTLPEALIIPAPRQPADDAPTVTIHDDTPRFTTEQIEQLLIATGRQLAAEQRAPTDDQLHQALRQKTADCPNCAYRYSRCYCPAPEP